MVYNHRSCQDVSDLNKKGDTMKNMLTVALKLVLVMHIGIPPAATGDTTPDVLRKMQYTSRSPSEARAWQAELREKLYSLLAIDDLIESRDAIALNAKKISSAQKAGHRRELWEIQSTPARTMQVTLTIPTETETPCPAVVCIHGHGGTQDSVYDSKSIYKGFAEALAQRGYVTIAANVGQHEVNEAGRQLMGERLWDLMRCVDFLRSRREIDPARIGCAGLSLGGEMAMWLGAMDERVAAVVSSGFLTVMDQMEQNHCMCWKFDGLRELVDFADIYSMIAPRPLQCQNGMQEPETMFTVSLAKQALEDIKIIYTDFDAAGRLALLVHAGGHEIDLPSLLRFFDESL